MFTKIKTTKVLFSTGPCGGALFLEIPFARGDGCFVGEGSPKPLIILLAVVDLERSFQSTESPEESRTLVL